MDKEYFEWMYSSVFTDPEGNYIPDYHSLASYLHSVQFEYTLPMDANRESDGINLRYHFGWYTGRSNVEIARNLDIHPCTVFEMMVALCRRMESDIMCDSDYGNRTYIWFQEMLKSLMIDNQTDDRFCDFIVYNALRIFMERKYDFNGRGGLFTLKNPSRDLKDVEIWDQAMWYLNEYIDDDGEYTLI